MAKFAVGKPVTTPESTITVDAGLPAGIHRFQLVVINAAGVKSAPDEVLIEVQSRPIIVDPRIRPVVTPTPIVTPVPVRPLQTRKRGKPS